MKTSYYYCVILSPNGSFSLPPENKKSTVIITSLPFCLQVRVIESTGKYFCFSSGCK